MAVRLHSKVLSSSLFKSFSFFARQKSDAHVVMTDDSSTIVCWHPETRFPYEMSLPLPRKEAIAESHPLLKVQSRKEFFQMIKPKREEVVIQELAHLTASTKHIWFPKKKQFRRKKGPDPDRPYL